MDLSKRGHLTASEKAMLAQMLQVYVLDGLGETLKDPSGRLVFHGGTAISSVHGSARWSEDLDFVVTPRMSGDLEAVRQHVEARASARIQDITPGARFELIDKGRARGKVREADPGTVMRWTGRWEHPMRHGVVRMKAEFYLADEAVVARYDTLQARPEANGIEADHTLPAATLETIWADKIMAMSARPAMKWRDVHDMGFIMQKIGDVPDDRLFERLEVARDSYRSDMAAIHEGLGRESLATLPDAFDAFAADMATWLPEMALNRGRGMQTLRSFHASCCDQVERARRMILERCPDIATDAAEEGPACAF